MEWRSGAASPFSVFRRVAMLYPLDRPALTSTGPDRIILSNLCNAQPGASRHAEGSPQGEDEGHRAAGQPARHAGKAEGRGRPDRKRQADQPRPRTDRPAEASRWRLPDAVQQGEG